MRYVSPLMLVAAVLFANSQEVSAQGAKTPLVQEIKYTGYSGPKKQVTYDVTTNCVMSEDYSCAAQRFLVSTMDLYRRSTGSNSFSAKDKVATFVIGAEVGKSPDPGALIGNTMFKGLKLKSNAAKQSEYEICYVGKASETFCKGMAEATAKLDAVQRGWVDGKKNDAVDVTATYEVVDGKLLVTIDYRGGRFAPNYAAMSDPKSITVKKR